MTNHNHPEAAAASRPQFIDSEPDPVFGVVFGPQTSQPLAWPEIEAGQWRSKITPACVSGSILSWIADGVPILLAGNRDRAAKLVARLLYLAARNRWRESRALVGGILEPDPDVFPATADESCTVGVQNG